MKPTSALTYFSNHTSKISSSLKPKVFIRIFLTIFEWERLLCRICATNRFSIYRVLPQVKDYLFSLLADFNQDCRCICGYDVTFQCKKVQVTVIIVIDPTSHEQSQTFNNNYHRDVKIGTRNRRRIQTHKDARDDTLNSN